MFPWLLKESKNWSDYLVIYVVILNTALLGDSVGIVCHYLTEVLFIAPSYLLFA